MKTQQVNWLKLRHQLSVMVGGCVLTTYTAMPAYASDVEVYTNGAFQANPVVMFALDNSGSMSGNGNTSGRKAYDLKDSMEAVLLGQGTGAAAIAPVQNIRAGLSTFDSPAKYAINDASGNLLYYTAVIPSVTVPTPPRRNAGIIRLGANQKLDDPMIYPSTRQDLIPSNGDVISKVDTYNNANTTINSSALSGGTTVAVGGLTTSNHKNTKGYIRFQVDVPRGATINHAYLEFRSQKAGTETPAPPTSGNLMIRVARANSLYAASPTVSRLYSFTGAAGTRSVQSGVDVPYLNTIFTSATTQRTVPMIVNQYNNDNIGANGCTTTETSTDPDHCAIAVRSFDVTSEMTALIHDNTDWCGMGDAVFEVAKNISLLPLPLGAVDYTFYGNREDRVNPKLYIDWTLTDSTTRASNCLYADTKRTPSQLITNLGSTTAPGAAKARQLMNLEIQRIIMDTRTPSATMYAETVAYMLGNTTKPLTQTSPANSSFDDALPELKVGTGTSAKYKSPIVAIQESNAAPSDAVKTAALNKEVSCGKNGIYFLTDGKPDTPPANDAIYQNAMAGSALTCSVFDNCAQAMAKSLSKGSVPSSVTAPTHVPNVQILTSTVGFGTTADATATAALTNWAAAGGGSYTGVSSTDTGGAKAGVVTSINNFISDILDNPLPGLSAGAPTIPVDPLNPLVDTGDAYFPLFKPLSGGTEPLWIGNLKRYKVDATNQTYVDKSTTPVHVIGTDGLPNPNAVDYWNGTSPVVADGGDVFAAGVLNKMPGPINSPTTTRTLYTEGANTSPSSLTQIDSTTTDSNKSYLWGLLGYNSDASSATLPTTYQRQMGGILHSAPVLVTYGATVNSSGAINPATRDDYVLYGTLQGLVTLVDASTGVEKWSFVPDALVHPATTDLNPNSPQNFLAQGKATRTTASPSYGMDGPWTVYSELSAKNTTTAGVTTATIAPGKIYAYGGMRMGGYNYYGLNLSTKATPSLLFRATHTRMGETWSKPVITKVRMFFGGKLQTKLVMIVGGGYDPAYESRTYAPTSGEKGDAVYMFDATNGNLLWWGGSDATSSAAGTTSASSPSIATKIFDMKYSIPSRVKVVDRDADGFADHIYVGDLAGQVFRIDINNNAQCLVADPNSATNPCVNGFIKNVRTIAKLGATTPVADGIRFYDAPSFSIFKDATTKKLFAAVVIGSGNRSFPLKGTLTDETLPSDYTFVLFDRNVTSAGLFNGSVVDTSTATDSDATSASSLASDVVATNQSTSVGWKHLMDSGHNSKVIAEPVVVANDLYMTAIDPLVSATSNTCNGGISGTSKLYKMVLPYGSSTAPTVTVVGQGLVAPGFGNDSNGTSGGVVSTAVILPNPTCTPVAPATTCTAVPPSSKYQKKAILRPLNLWREKTSSVGH